MNKSAAIQKINILFKNKDPFFMISDFEADNFKIFTAKNLKDKKILFNFNKINNISTNQITKKNFEFLITKPDFEKYSKQFKQIQKELNYGNSYLCNLTCPVRIQTNYSLEDLFHLSDAKYKIYCPECFTCFSPETFIRIQDKKISTYPMKGTLNNSKLLINNPKEAAEHSTIVDLLRNDLSLIAKNVHVVTYRYLERIIDHSKSTHYQSSSEISGELPDNYNLGEVITSLLPAGSISGAPKKETLRIIKETENYKRGFYTGIAGYFDGKNFDSCVMIRFIEKIDNQLYFKTGGGITADSNLEDEYNELLGKIYVPIYRDN